MLAIVRTAIESTLAERKAQYAQTSFLTEAAVRNLATHRAAREKLRTEIKELEDALSEESE